MRADAASLEEALGLLDDEEEEPLEDRGFGPQKPFGPQKLLLQEQQLVTHMKIRSGDCIKVKGKIEADAKSFAINLGQNESELIFHFNPRFESQGDVRTIICNSKTSGKWGKEVREETFPFQQGEEFKLFVCFDAERILVKMPKGQELKFPNRLKIHTAEYFSIVGDLRIKTVRFD